MTMHYTRLADVVKQDPRYAYEAYEFLFDALEHTQKLLGRVPPKGAGGEVLHECHVTGPELVHGVRDLALREFGLMARTVFHLWGIHSTADFGEIVFNLIESELMSKTPNDCRNDFHDVYDFDEALVHGYRICLDEAE
jgi:uncharacterized repeat protein (TIGR04138 family)